MDKAWEEFRKCVFCGFCEASCPTLAEARERGYGPRGRVRVVGLLLNGIYSEKTSEYLYTCLLCYACVPPCPTGVDIPGIVEAGRILANRVIANKPKVRGSPRRLPGPHTGPGYTTAAPLLSFPGGL